MKNVSNLANDILKSAQMFTVKKPLKIKENAGSTRESLQNAKLIHEAGYELLDATMAFNKKKANYYLECHFERDGDIVPWTFKGFALGYGGEGPHGLRDAMALWGIDVSDIAFGDKITPEVGIIKLK